MSKLKTFGGKTVKEIIDDDLYDDDFEDYDYAEGVEGDGKLVTPSMSLTSTAVSLSPENDSAENNTNTKGSEFVDYEFMSSLESDYNYPEDDQTTGSGNQSFDFRLFHRSLDEIPITKQKRFKNGTRSSLTFSNQRVREIDRENQILLTKIMKNGPAGDGLHISSNKLSLNQRSTPVKSSAEVNRKKKQQKIDYENQILKRKLDKIASRRT